MIADITVVPIGSGTSLSSYIAEAVKAFESYKHEITATGTIVEVETFNDLSKILNKIKDNLLKAGVKRIFFSIKIDYKTEADTIERKVKSVLAKLEKE